jgi:myo-inositol catabolism protein IolC
LTTAVGAAVPSVASFSAGAKTIGKCEWLATAGAVPGFIGFAVGRTSWWDPLVDCRGKNVTREAAVSEIARRHQQIVKIFETRQMPVAGSSILGSSLEYRRQ